MRIPVLIEAVPGQGYRASGGEPFALVGEGATPADALAQFRQRLADKLQGGASVATVEVESTDHPWRSFFGMYDPSDPLVQEWLDIMRIDNASDETSP